MGVTHNLSDKYSWIKGLAETEWMHAPRKPISRVLLIWKFWSLVSGRNWLCARHCYSAATSGWPKAFEQKIRRAGDRRRTLCLDYSRSLVPVRRVEVAAARLLLRPPSSNRTGGITASGSPKDFFLRRSRATAGRQGHTQRFPAQQQQVVPPSAFRRLGMATLASA